MNKSITGQAHITITRRNTNPLSWEFEITHVQRDGHKELIGMRPYYLAHQIKRSTIRAGVHGTDTQRIVFIPTGQLIQPENGRYVALIEWTPGETDPNKFPRVAGIGTQAEFDKAEQARQLVDNQHRRQQECLPTAQQSWRTEKDAKKVQKKVKIGQDKPVQTAFKPFVAPRPEVDLINDYSVSVLGNGSTGTLRDIVDYFTRKWAENPREVLTCAQAQWKKREGMSYGAILPKPPVLPSVNNEILREAQEQRKTLAQTKARRQLAHA